MKIRFSYFFWIISLALGLMMFIYLAQLFTNRNIKGLKKGNREAAISFTVRNSLQEIVNIVFVLETKLLTKKIAASVATGIKDSLTLIGYNASVLSKLNIDTSSRKMLQQLSEQVNREVSFSYQILAAADKKNQLIYKTLTDSLKQIKLSDSIYNTSLIISKQLEKVLQQTLDKNTLNSRNLSVYNKILALIAIAAILILATIIINRHSWQLKLIADLEKANRQVKESAIIKEQFLANMSHEIRTPLNAIKGFSGLILQTDLNAEQQQHAEIIETASNNLLEIVNDVLDISKIESGKLQLEIKEFNLHETLQLLQLMFANAAANKKINYHWHIAETIPVELLGDADHLNQILINLISNAIKFTPYGHVNLLVEEIKKSGNKIWLQFKIEDTGIGLSEDKLEKIFERFYQVRNTGTTLQKGTGLGLAIVKNLANLMGGDVTAQSHTGKGTVFTVQLPFDINPVRTSTNVPDILSLAMRQFKNTNVLVAEDNTINQLLVGYLLKKYGITPVFVQNGWEVIEKLQQEHFDLLLLDIQMPVMNGYQTMRKIAELNLHVPVVAMTAYVMPGDKEKCLAAGMDDYISKPINEIYLQKILNRYLGNKMATAADIEKTDAGYFLLNLSGGDKQMAETILKEVFTELQKEKTKLQYMPVVEQNRDKLRAFCHHLVSTISPLGNETAAMKTISSLQLALTASGWDKNIPLLVSSLKEQLDNLQLQKFIS